MYGPKKSKNQIMDLEEMAQIIFVAHKEAASYIGFSRPKSIL